MAVQIDFTAAQLLPDFGGVLLKVKDAAAMRQLEAFLQGFQPSKDYCAVLGEKRQKRSLDANRYAWVLLGKLEAKLGVPKVEIYRNLIRDVPGAADVVPIQEGAPAERFREIWERRGLGWQCEQLDKASLPGYVLLQCWYGSSEYDTKQMARLIDLILQECKQQDIETATPDEINKMIGLMEAER
jgi:hypothetical protein